MKKKIGILTFHYSTKNFGAVLQTFASYVTLKNLGLLPVVINLQPGKRLPLFSRLKQSVRYILHNNIQFIRFIKTNTKITKVYYSGNKLRELNKRFDGFYVGSDQVWRASMAQERLLHYFLDFADKDKLKIAYAPSFGISKWEGNKDDTKQAKILIQKFNKIGVREQDGIDICKNLFDVHVVKVLDPTLLLDGDVYRRLMITKHKFQKEAYIGYYLLQNIKNEDIKNKFKLNQLNLTILNLYGKKKRIARYEYFRFYAVGEWLFGVQNASLIITDSFHCVIFAVLFKRQFVCIKNERGGISRIENLLKSLHLEDRFCDDKDIDIEYYLNLKIDFEKVYSKLDMLREESIRFLKDAIQN